VDRWLDGCSVFSSLRSFVRSLSTTTNDGRVLLSSNNDDDGCNRNRNAAYRNENLVSTIIF
jgi:hypothetical protein